MADEVKKAPTQKYLTDLKELSEETVEAPPVSSVSSLPPVPAQAAVVPVAPGAPETKKLPVSPKELILIIINVFSAIFLLILLTKLPGNAEELRTLRASDIQDEASLSFEFNRVNAHKNDSDALEKVFLDESGVVTFVDSVEKLKSPASAIQGISFTAPKSVKDRTGNFGIPVVIEMSGSWEAIGNDLEKIQGLSFVYRPITFEAKPNFENPSMVDVKYGLFLYVKD
jgi:hypothetical protein